MVSNFCNCFSLFLLVQSAKPWDLSHIGIENYSIRHVSIFRNHAYVSIKECGNSHNVTCPTLIEAPWPKNSIHSAKPRAFPSLSIVRNACERLQNVVSTDVDLFGRMWILDRGSYPCPGKLIVYNLYTQQILRKFQFVDGNLKLSSVIVDSTQLHWNNKAFVGVSNKNIIFICQYKYKKCFVYYLKNNNAISSTEEIVLSKKDDSLYITSKTTLHVVYLETIRKQIFMAKDNTTISAHYIGDKLGYSRGLIIIDQLDILCYYLLRDYAIVCWYKKKPLMAENHDVLVQNYKVLPNVQQLLVDVQNNMWAINNPSEKKTMSTKNKYNNNPTCIKIVKFDQILNTLVFSSLFDNFVK